MRILVDTNVIVDDFLKREPFYQDSHKIVQLCSGDEVEGFLAAHSITNLFYILRKSFSNSQTREMILELFKAFNVESIDTSKLIRALVNENFKDFEDRLQIECAVAIKANYIVTRNTEDFSESEISCVTPAEFCSMFDGTQGDLP